MRLKQEASFLIPCLKHIPTGRKKIKPDLSKLSSAGYRVYDGSQVKSSSQPPPRTVVDLHIEKLADNWQKMGNVEKLDPAVKKRLKNFMTLPCNITSIC